MDKTKIAIIGAATLLTGTAAYFIIKKRKQKSLMQSSINTATNQAINQTSNSVKNIATGNNPLATAGFPLQVGSRGENVKKVQAFLNQKINAGLVVDGIFGAKTAEAVRKAIGKTNVSESEFKTYIGAPALMANASTGKNIFLKALSTINPVFSLFK